MHLSTQTMYWVAGMWARQINSYRNLLIVVLDPSRNLAGHLVLLVRQAKSSALDTAVPDIIHTAHPLHEEASGLRLVQIWTRCP